MNIFHHIQSLKMDFTFANYTLNEISAVQSRPNNSFCLTLCIIIISHVAAVGERQKGSIYKRSIASLVTTAL